MSNNTGYAKVTIDLNLDEADQITEQVLRKVLMERVSDVRRTVTMLAQQENEFLWEGLVEEVIDVAAFKHVHGWFTTDLVTWSDMVEDLGDLEDKIRTQCRPKLTKKPKSKSKGTRKK